jgi:hypothetical protein
MGAASLRCDATLTSGLRAAAAASGGFTRSKGAPATGGYRQDAQYEDEQGNAHGYDLGDMGRLRMAQS